MKKILILILLAQLYPIMIQSQELDATVTLNVEQLPNPARDRLINFENVVQDYLNNNKYTSGTWEGERIKCSFTIFFLGSPDETSYNAQLVVSSQRPVESSPISSLMLSIMDNAWGFKYEKGQGLYFNQSDFDPLTSMLDYYAYIIIGFDFDSYYSLGGTDYFRKAMDIAMKGGGSRFAKGWQFESTIFNRYALVDNLLNAKYQQFRQDYFDYHYNGIDLFYTKDRAVGIKNIIKLIKNLEIKKDQIDWRSVLMKVFFDAKAGEFASYLQNYEDKSIFTSLKRIDPAHAAKYDEALR
jgi:hypothetical protein